MTRKDYILIADVIRKHFSVDRYEPWEEIALAFGLELEKDNPRFDLKTFLLACEPKY